MPYAANMSPWMRARHPTPYMGLVRFDLEMQPKHTQRQKARWSPLMRTLPTKKPPKKVIARYRADFRVILSSNFLRSCRDCISPTSFYFSGEKIRTCPGWQKVSLGAQTFDKTSQKTESLFLFRQNSQLPNFIRDIVQFCALLLCEHGRNAANKGIQTLGCEAAITLAPLHLRKQRTKEFILAFALILGNILFQLAGALLLIL